MLGDDLALNAQQVTGVRAEREIPVVWGVAKGSFINKLILVPLALLISVIAPWLINPLLMIGGLFLCYEGVEKVIHSLKKNKIHSEEEQTELKIETVEDLATFEKEKIKGAIRTDFILSAEIIVISLGTVATATLLTKISVLSIIAIAMTIGVYGLVAMIVKIDDLGLYCVQKKSSIQQILGRGLLAFAPKLMKTLSVVGTIAMFLVGGGIISHVLPFVHHWNENLLNLLINTPMMEQVMNIVAPTIFNLIFGFLAGVIVILVVSSFQKIWYAIKTV